MDMRSRAYAPTDFYYADTSEYIGYEPNAKTDIGNNRLEFPQWEDGE